MRSWSLKLGLILFAAACGGDDEPQLAQPAPDVDAGVAPPATTTAPTAPPPPADSGPKVEGPFDIRTWTPKSKGLWIWYWDYIGMSPAEAATKAKALGVSYVLIKSAQNGNFWTERFNAAGVAEFQSRGIRVLAWPYITPAGGSAAIEAAAQAAKVPGCDGLILDVEVEWEGEDDSAAAKLCDGIRAKVPGVFLGYTSFGWAALHKSFPWKGFDEHCGDAALPQVYFSDRGVKWDSPKGLADALTQYKSMNLKAPVWPIGSNDDYAGTDNGPTAIELNAFFAAAGPHVSLWEFPGKTRPEKLSQLGELLWPNP